MMDLVLALGPIFILFGMFVILVIDTYKEYKLKKKIDLLKYMMDKGYETDNIDKILEL